MERINPKDVAEKYNSIDIIWDEKDRWHTSTKKTIDEFIYNSLKHIPNYKELKILNAGSAGYSYGLEEKNILHIDIAEERISHLPNSLIADIHNIPLPEKQFDIIICVGSVINYCDPIQVIKEFDRLLNIPGYIILEFENSYTLELLGKSSFNKKATFVESFYKGAPEKIWFFSESYIRELFNLSGFNIVSKTRCHIISPLIYRLFKNENFAAKFVILDKICSYIPIIKKFSSNTIFLINKN